ncbi:F-box/LRR-repeat protein 3 isoform X2 [Cannabis sativa]|nr:F-box/LRR-repeat protein 3 isoform X2 [Cannabis sativa]
MKKLKKDIENRDPNPNMTNPFDIFTDEIVYAILDHLHGDPFSKRSFSSVCKSFYFIESRHRRALKPLRSDLLPRTFRRYSSISHLDLSLCSLVDDNNLAAVSVAWKSTLRSINLSRSRAFSSIGLLTLVNNCSGLVEIDLSNGTELTDSAAKAIAEARNLEILRLSRCKSITDIGIGCIAVGCKKLKTLCLRWCLRITDLGVGLIAMKCKEIQSLDLSYLPITEKCLSHILQLQHLEDLILEGCHGIDDNGLSTLNHTCKSIKMINMSNCQSLSYIGLSSLTNGANSLEQLILANGPSVTADLAKCLSQFSSLRSIKLDGCLVTCSGINSIANWSASLVELSFSKCSGLTDECLCFLAERHKELRKLDITCCRKITIASIEGITKSCTSLTSLRMESCSLVSKEAFVLIGQHCQMLEDLDVTDNEMDDEGLKAISRCSRLQSLKLGICLNMTDEGLIHVGRGCSKLKELDLYRCAGVTDRGIEAIGHGCPALEMINIAYNSKITDTSLISLSKCSSLKVLEIRGCPHISSVGLSSIAMECRQLSELDIKKCFNINDNAMHPLGKFSQNLQQINLSYCSVTDAGLLSVTRINRLRNMTILHLSGLTPNGLAAALLTCGGLTKVKLHSSFKPLLPQYIYKYMESRGCVFHWRNKAFQEEIDPKGWQLHLGRPS